MADPLVGTAVGTVLGFLGGWALKYVGPKSQVVFWYPHNSFFQVPQPGARGTTFNVLTSSVTVQNLGRRPARNVELMYDRQPDHFTVSPPRPWTDRTTPQGQHLITMATLGHNEWFTVEVLGFANLAALVHIRSDDGEGRLVPVMQQRIYPSWAQQVFVGCFLIGVGVLLYWILRGLRALAHVLGWL